MCYSRSPAFERGGNIFSDYVQHKSLALGYAGGHRLSDGPITPLPPSITQGGRFAGWGLLMLDGKLVWAYKNTQQPGDGFGIDGPDKEAAPAGRWIPPY
ncbi:hypothetical protein [Rhizobium sp. 18055]|uniref:hypothetical protein n=1 Tax=Rhizobium sp. 18055 TaxID=2681403 RepID=UPI0013572151|nr:hypothetical protein [Rhizobium sp. 18055]